MAGALPSHGEWRQIADLCDEHNTRLLSDEMYQGLERNQNNTLASAAALGARHVALSGVSKWGALPGLRIGWLVSRDESLVVQFNELKDYVSICPPSPSEFLAKIALDNKYAVLARSRGLCNQGLEATRDFCVRHADWIDWIEPLGTSVCFPKLRHRGASATAWCNELADDADTRLMLIPSSMFDHGDSHFRIGYGRANTAELICRLERHIRKHGPPGPVIH